MASVFSRYLMIVLCWLAFTTTVSAQENPAHENIRTMRDAAISAFMARDKDTFLAHFSDEIIFTAMNNDVVRGKEAASAYWDRMFSGSSGLVDDLQMEFAVDDLTTLYVDDKTGVASGEMSTEFKMRAGLEFSVPLRWTATLVEQPDGWKVAALHFSANMFANPLDNSLRKYLWLMLAGILLVGLILGWVIGRRTSRRVSQ